MNAGRTEIMNLCFVCREIEPYWDVFERCGLEQRCGEELEKAVLLSHWNVLEKQRKVRYPDMLQSVQQSVGAVSCATFAPVTKPIEGPSRLTMHEFCAKEIQIMIARTSTHGKDLSVAPKLQCVAMTIQGTSVDVSP